MESAVLGAVGGAVAMLVAVGALLLLARARRSRSDLATMLAAAQREADDLRLRLEAAEARLAVTGAVTQQREPIADQLARFRGYRRSKEIADRRRYGAVPGLEAPEPDYAPNCRRQDRSLSH